MPGTTPYLEADDYDVEVDIDDYDTEDFYEGGAVAAGGGYGHGGKAKAPKKPRQVKSVMEYLRAHKKDKTYNRVLKASKLHPGASLYELQHGVGSKASTKYRAKHYPERAAEVDHEAIHRAFQESGYKVLRDGQYVRGAITGVHGHKVVLYGGTFVYDAKKDKGHHYDRVTEELLAQVEARLHHPRRSR